LRGIGDAADGAELFQVNPSVGACRSIQPSGLAMASGQTRRGVQNEAEAASRLKVFTTSLTIQKTYKSFTKIGAKQHNPRSPAAKYIQICIIDIQFAHNND
jgi:hypothetical protein